MRSIVDELIEKIRLNPSLLERSGPRQDLGLLLFSRREALDALWKAADRAAPFLEGAAPFLEGAAPFLEGEAPLLEGESSAATSAGAELRRAVEELRPLFGER